MIQTKRLNISLMSNEQMEQLISKQLDPELKKAYTEMLQGCICHPKGREWYAVWNMELNDGSGTVVGDLSFKGMSENGTVEIGYGTYAGYENQGYMTEAVSAIVKWASTQPGVKIIEAEAEIDNHASKRVLEKTGFIANGIIGEEGPRYTWMGQDAGLD